MGLGQLKREALIHMEIGVRGVLSGKMAEYKTELCSPSEINDFVISIGGSRSNEESDSNGWQCDCWFPVTYGGKEWTIGGSGFYGTTSFYDKEE